MKYIDMLNLNQKIFESKYLNVIFQNNTCGALFKYAYFRRAKRKVTPIKYVISTIFVLRKYKKGGRV